MVKMGNTPASGCGTFPMDPSPEIYHKRNISTSCLDLQMYGSLDMVPMTLGHHRSTSDPLIYISVAPSMNLHQADTENIELKMDCDENRSEPTIEEYKLWAQRAFLQQKVEYINNLRLLTAKIKMIVDALKRNVDGLKRLTTKYIEVKKERDSLLYILSKIHKGK
ncbi:hypothetical protein AAG906_037260 [Vitis piasezkii]